MSPFFERFFILGGPRGFREKNVQILDSITIRRHAQGRPKGPCAFRSAIKEVLDWKYSKVAKKFFVYGGPGDPAEKTSK
jgi:hypothetical protein